MHIHIHCLWRFPSINHVWSRNWMMILIFSTKMRGWWDGMWLYRSSTSLRNKIGKPTRGFRNFIFKGEWTIYSSESTSRCKTVVRRRVSWIGLLTGNFLAHGITFGNLMSLTFWPETFRPGFDISTAPQISINDKNCSHNYFI